MNRLLEWIDTINQSSTSTITRDLRLNLKRLLSDGALEGAESLSALLALASATDHRALMTAAMKAMSEEGIPENDIIETRESAAIMGMLNTYYRFKTMIENDEDYRSAGLRMTSLANPAMGKMRFEMLSFAISVLNGCASCTRSHEHVLREHGVSTEKIHDLARLAAVVKGLAGLDGASVT